MKWSTDKQFKKVEALMDAAAILRKRSIEMLCAGNIRGAQIVDEEYRKALEDVANETDKLLAEIRGGDRELARQEAEKSSPSFRAWAGVA